MRATLLLLVAIISILSCDHPKLEKAGNLLEEGRKLESLQLPDSAMIIYQQAIKELQKVKDDTLSGIIYNRIGDIMFDNSLYSESFIPYSKALTYNTLLNDQTETSRSLRGMGKSLLLRDLNDSAIIYLKKALSLSSHIRNKEEVSLIHNNLSFAYLELEEFDSSLVHNAKASQLSQDSINIYKNNCIRGDLFMQTKQYDSAFVYYKSGCKSSNIRTQVACYYALTTLAKVLNSKDSSEYINAFRILKDSIERNSRSLDILKKDKQYDVQKTKEELTGIYLYITIAVIILSLIFIFSFARRHRGEKKKNEELIGIAKKLQVEMSRLECKLERAIEKNEIQQKQHLDDQLQKVKEIATTEIKRLGNKQVAEFRKSDTYREMKEKLSTGRLTQKERNIFRKKTVETFQPFFTYLATFLDFSSDDCLYCCLTLLKFTTRECALCRNITEDAIRSQKRRLKSKIKETFGSDTLYEYIFLRDK